MDFKRTSWFHFLQVFVPLMVILTVVVGILYRADTGAIASQIRSDDTGKIQLGLRIIRVRLRSLDADTLYLANLHNLRNWINDRNPSAKRGARGDMQVFMAHHPDYAQLRYLDARGHEVIRIDNRKGQSLAIPDDQLQNKSGRYYIEAIRGLRDGGIYLSAFDLNVEHGKIQEPHQPMIRIGTPVFDREHRYRGSVVLNYLGEALLNELRNLNRGDARQLWLLNDTGYWLLGPSRDREWGFMWKDHRNVRLQSTYPRVWSDIRTKPQHNTTSDTRDLFTYTPVDSSKFLPDANRRTWYLVAFTPRAYIDAQTDVINKRLGWLYVLVTLLIILLSWLLTRKELARARSERQLREQEQQYRSLLEGAPDAIVIVNRDGEIHLVNSESEHLFGYSRDELVGKSVDILLPERFQDRHHHHRRGYIENPTVRPMGESQELFAHRKDGSEVPVEISLSPLRGSGEMLVTAVIRDVTVRKEREGHVRELNRNLVARTTELEAINAELEAFSYSVSHDLRAPLRAVDGFSHTLLKDYGAQLDERGRDRLERVRAAAQRMGMLIDDLLTLSRISRADVNRSEVDMTELAGKIVTELRQSEPERHAEFVVQSELSAYADARLLSVALTNLLSNAWKFTSRVDGAYIEIQGCHRDGEYVYSVEDNGAGFNMAYADKLFGAFQRLHDGRDFPGTGIGLATVQRVVHKHGGRVWAEAEEGKGAKFYFTLNRE